MQLEDAWRDRVAVRGLLRRDEVVRDTATEERAADGPRSINAVCDCSHDAGAFRAALRDHSFSRCFARNGPRAAHSGFAAAARASLHTADLIRAR